MKIKHVIAAAVSTLTFAAIPAQAGVVAMADLAINALGLQTTTGLFTAVQVNGETRTGNASSNYNGPSSNGGNASSNTAGATVDVTYRCAGDCANPAVSAAYGGQLENNSTTHLNSAVANYALGDMLISGSVFGGQGNASGLTRANAAAVAPTNEGGANATIQNGLSVTTTFTATQTASVQVFLAFDAFTRTWIDALSTNQSATASASIGWGIEVYQGATKVMDWKPEDLNKNFSAFSPLDNLSYAKIGAAASDFFTVNAGQTYRVTIQQSSNATMSYIPEPASLALVGLALLGVAGVSSRRRVK